MVYVGSEDGKLYAFAVGCRHDGGTCSPLWTATTGNNGVSSPAVANGVVYVGSGGTYPAYANKLNAFAVGCASGGGSCTPLWTANTSSGIGDPAVANGVVYVGSGGDRYAFAVGCASGGATCTPLWTSSTAGGGSSFAVANGVVYVGGDKLYAYALPAAATLAVSGVPSPYAAGAVHSVTVTAKDAHGNIAVGYRGTIHFTSTDGHAVMPADYTFMAGDAGVHKFMPGVTLKTAGSQAVRARDTVTATITGVENRIVVTPGRVSTLAVSGLTSPRTVGSAGTFTVSATDAGGNVIGGYRGTVHFTSTDTHAVLPANYTFTAVDSGTHTFSVTLKTAGSQSVRARDTLTSTITGGQYPIVVKPAAATTLVVSGLTSPRTAGVAGNMTVTARDAYGNAATGYRGTIGFTSTDSKAVLPANYTFTAANAGTHAFSVTLKTAGTQAVRARDTVTATITGLQLGIVVT